MKTKLVILGAGHVGSHVTFSLAMSGLAEELVLVDILPEKAYAQALDIADSVSNCAHQTIVRAGTHADCADASLVIVAIGEPRKPGQTRLDLIDRSIELVDVLIDQLRPLSLTCPIVTITNPADVVADYLRKGLHYDRRRCFSTGTLLDTARLVRILSEATGTDRRSICAYALGEHGDSSLAAFSAATVGGIALSELKLDMQPILNATRSAGMDIINGKGSTEFGIGQATVTLCDAILRDAHRVMPVSVLLEGEYGQRDVHCGVPCRIGINGVEEIIQLPLTAQEQALLDHSCDIIRTYIEKGRAHHEAITKA